LNNVPTYPAGLSGSVFRPPREAAGASFPLLSPTPAEELVGQGIAYLVYSLIKTIKSKLRNLSSDSKSVLTLVGGTTIAQALNFLFSPIQTRLFSPEVFGELSVFTSITGIVGIIICLRYELAIVLPKDDDEGSALYRLSLLFAAIVSGIAGLVFLFWHTQIYSRFKASALSQYWYYVPVVLLLTGIIQASNYWLTRQRKFKVLSLNKVLPVIATNVLSIGLGLAGNIDLSARLVAVLAGNIVNIAVIYSSIAPQLKRQKEEKQYKYGSLVKKYKNFLVYDIWGALINNLSWMIVPILMNSYYGSFAAGQYSIGLRVVQIPASLIGASIYQVFLKNASDKRHEKKLYPYAVETLKKLLLYTAPIGFMLLLLGKPLFLFLFGSKWGLAGIYCQILAPWAILWFCASPMHSVFTITQRQNVYLVFSVVNLLTRFVSLYFGNLLKSDIWGIIFFSVSGFFVYGVSLILALKQAKESDRAH
jgi:O-antigen/teichoic acid export membrane protein